MSFFAPPPTIETEVFTRLPDSLRRKRRSAWADANRAGKETDSFLEGPSFDRQGRLYVTDIPNGRVFRISVDGEWEQVAEYDGWPNGLKIHQDGRIFITCYKHGIMELDAATGQVSPFLESVGSESFKGVNDLVFAANGDLYFTDQGQTGLHDPTGRVYRYSASGVLTCLLDTIPSPNGIVIDAKATNLLVAVTRANQIWRIPLHPSGLVSKVGCFAYLHGGPSGPDGLALDEDGGLLIAHAGFGTVWHLSARAEPIARIASCVPGLATTNLAIGGPERKTLFITESETGTILRASLRVAGQPMYSHHE